MTVPRATLWPIDPHTIAKHRILDAYLKAWFAILGRNHPRIVYIDGFCGPGRYSGGETGSPILALRTARDHVARLPEKLTFWFIDERQDRIDHLKQEIGDLGVPKSWDVHVECGTFAASMSTALGIIETAKATTAPLFAFIDPFGYEGIPFDVIQRILRLQRSEVFINLMVDSIRRWLAHDPTREAKLTAFGTERVFDVLRGDGDRMEHIRGVYNEQLRTAARFVRHFEMQDEHRRPIYDLFFATNHPLGHEKMKVAMRGCDSSGGYRFSDATNPNQSLLFSTDPSPLLDPELQRQFRDRGAVRKEELQRFVNDETGFIAKDLTAALRRLEDANLIQVVDLRDGGKLRKKGTFPDGVAITFV